jgi:adenosylcobinamide kinase/adenosylcobinamide-phosphate guanylyltransferase
MNRILLVGGGVRSGKSRWALDTARRLGERRLFVATARPSDAEMRERIERHRADRPDFGETVEEALALPELLRDRALPEVVVVDCLSHWLTNILGLDDREMLARVDALAEALLLRRAHVVLVTNEVGLSLHADTQLGRRFQALSGFMHQRVSSAADEVHLAILGLVVPLKRLSGGEG